MTDDISVLISKINKFRDDRNWRQFHEAKDLALSISLEASELLEIFQWKTSSEGIENIEGIKEELADVLIYSLMFADDLGLDIVDIIERKLNINEQKYPVNKSKNKKLKYTEL